MPEGDRPDSTGDDRRRRESRRDGSAPRRARGERDRAHGERRGQRADRGPRSAAEGARRHVRDRAPAPTAPPAGPPIDDDVSGTELDPAVRSELSVLRSQDREIVAKHLVMAGQLIDDDPDAAYEHAMAARGRAARLAVVREAVGIAAYAAGKYREALAELRAARRISGAPDYLPMMADCERGLGRPARALEIANDPDIARLDTPSRIEMLIVAAGARRDLGQLDAAIVGLQVPELRSQKREPWVARLRYAYADALEAAGRSEQALRWFIRAAEADRWEETDAADRAQALAGPQAEPED